jgi:hypothetical protein
MGARRELRLFLHLPVRITGVDAGGNGFEQDATTIDMTVTGVRLQGITHPLERGGIISIQYRGNKAKYRVRWVKKPDSALHGHIGLKLLDGETMNWGRTIPCILGDAFVEKPDEYDIRELK